MHTKKSKFPGKPPRLQRIFVGYPLPLYFVTCCTWERQSFLALEAAHEAFVEYARKNLIRSLLVGRYVLMPDHLHFFVQVPVHLQLGEFVRLMKQNLSRALKQCGRNLPHWQPGFFDHLVRNSESYGDKWEYVRDNPMRRGLVEKVEDWPYQGEIVGIEPM